jgi:RNA recognition motif-containing protein
MNIYVGNLSFKVEEDDLRELFEAYGEVESVKLIMDKFTGKSKGFGFVEIADKDQALKAIEELNNSEFEGRNIVVNQAREKTETGGGAGGGRPFRRNDSRGGGDNRGGGGGFRRSGGGGGRGDYGDRGERGGGGGFNRPRY